MEDNKKQTRSVLNGAPVAGPARRPVSATSARPVARPVGTTVASARPVADNGTVAATKATAPTAKPIAKTASTRVASDQSHVSQGIGSAKQEKKSTTKSNNKKQNLWIGICGGVLAIAIIIAIVAIIMNNNGGQQNGDTNEGNDVSDNALVDANSEEVKRTTQETIDKYAEVNVEGYKDMEGEGASGKAVIVTVKNTSNETVSLAITIGAYDHDGNLLDTSSVYAEGIGPEQTSRFNTFVFTELTPEQLSTAEYKVYTANTYETPWIEGGEETVEAGEEVVQSVEESTQEGSDGNE